MNTIKEAVALAEALQQMTLRRRLPIESIMKLAAAVIELNFQLKEAKERLETLEPIAKCILDISTRDFADSVRYKVK